MIEEKVYPSLLKVIKPYEGTAFVAVADPNIGVFAVSCIHVVVPDDADPTEERDVLLEYYPPNEPPVRIEAHYMPEQSDPDHDLAVLKLDLPEGLSIPTLPLSCDDQGGEDVVAIGFPNGQTAPYLCQGKIVESFHRLSRVNFVDGWSCEVLRIDTRGHGFWGDKLVHRGMSGGPIWNVRAQRVVAVIEGRKPRGESLVENPEGYSITLDHLARCSTILRSVIEEASPREQAISPPRGEALDRLIEWIMTHKTLALAIFLLVATVIGYWLAKRPPELPLKVDLLEKIVTGEATFGPFAPYGQVECEKEVNRLTIHYTKLGDGYNGCYINYSFDASDFRFLIINAEGRLNGGEIVPKQFVVELKKRGLKLIAQYKVSPSGQDVKIPMPTKGIIVQVTIVFFADTVGSPEGTIYINKLVLSREGGE